MKNFKIKTREYNFSSAKFLSSEEKQKIYSQWVKFLNSHFKFSLFTKDLYQHMNCRFGFIAHYNINGFYGEYFETPAKFHFNVNGYLTPANEYSGNMNQKTLLTPEKQFIAILDEIQSGRGLGEFTNSILRFNYGHEDNRDVNGAMRSALMEYINTFIDYEERMIEQKLALLDAFEPVKFCGGGEKPKKVEAVADNQPILAILESKAPVQTSIFDFL